jgi:hypothetical protein
MSWAEVAVIAWPARILLAAMFLRSGLAKIASPRAFELSVARFHVVPNAAAPAIARVLPPIEVVAAAALAAGLASTLVGLLIGLLLLAFAVALGVNLIRRDVVDCGCWGKSLKPITWWHVGRNVALACAAFTLAMPRLAASRDVGWLDHIAILFAIGSLLAVTAVGVSGWRILGKDLT